MKIKIWKKELKLAHEWTIASGVKTGGKHAYEVLFVQLTDRNGVSGLGEAWPPARYGESMTTVEAFLAKMDLSQISFADVPGSMDYLETIAPGNGSAKGAVNIALLDAAARLSGKAIFDYLGLGFTENKHITSFSIGIDTPDMIRKKVLEATGYPILKLKVGGPDDRQNMAALRSAAPTKTVRVDGNEGWKTKEEALENIQWFAQDSHVEFIEQPMPSTTPAKDLVWLKERSPLPIFADENYLTVKDINFCVECYHGVNVKLVKTGGISGAYAALQAARGQGLKTMIGCMIESSVLITAAAHLAEWANHLDIDGNLLITNDPYFGATAKNGVISFAQTPEKLGLRVKERN